MEQPAQCILNLWFNWKKVVHARNPGNIEFCHEEWPKIGTHYCEKLLIYIYVCLVSACVCVCMSVRMHECIVLWCMYMLLWVRYCGVTVNAYVTPQYMSLCVRNRVCMRVCLMWLYCTCAFLWCVHVYVCDVWCLLEPLYSCMRVCLCSRSLH